MLNAPTDRTSFEVTEDSVHKNVRGSCGEIIIYTVRLKLSS